MSTFFEIRPNTTIGFKLLTQNDLGLKDGSGVTHIGLFKGTLEFLSNAHRNLSATLIYQNLSLNLFCPIDLITRESGNLDAPKIRSGTKLEKAEYGITVVEEIRKTVKANGIDKNWYLIWFGLTNEDLVFYLFKEGSDEYNKISQNYIPKLLELQPTSGRGKVTGGSISPSSPTYNKLLEYLQIKTDDSSSDYLQSLEVLAEIGDFDPQGPVDEIVLKKIKKYRRYDLDKAKQKQKETGQKGEILINEYLLKLKDKKEIKGFVWENEYKESHLPYDFKIETLSEDVFMDVKTTSYKFEQGMVFSRNELRCAYDNKNYHVYRVFDIDKDSSPALRICRDLKVLSKTLVEEVDILEKKIKNSYQGLKSIKFEISPDNPSLIFDDKIAI